MNSTVRLRQAGQQVGRTLTLTRDPLPRFLRFVITGDDWQTLDALDKLDDMPKPAERVIAAERDPRESSTFHMSCRDKNGRRYGEWGKSETYDVLTDQPSQETLVNTPLWQAWCMERVKGGTPS